MVETEVSEVIPSTSRIQTGLPKPEDAESGVLQRFSALEEVASYSIASNTKSQKQIHQRSGSGSSDTSLGSSVQRSFASRNNSQVANPAYLDSSHGQRNDAVRKRSPVAKSSSARSKNMTGSLTGGKLVPKRNSLSSSSLSLSECPSSQQAPRRGRKWPPSSDGVVLVRTRRTITGDTRERIPDHGNGNSGNSENLHSRPIPHPEDGIHRPFQGLSRHQDGFQRYNMDGIAEVFLALERIEQDEELTYEHRDMRLDIDNLSYEELFALGEKMCTVSTALTEEALLNCLKKNCYMHAPPDAGSMGCEDDDVKCSICRV
ncbi:hypothetical protein HHK36_033408 [Tetracentron sinense]|uniref:RING-type E3 ubiquitin transferase n=1 Tax=Tetracentron sinense TaxID=13715 RepID=A0A835CWQ2_TETSI|nr:hypothetical protein HHK36_033408 [Tetracentron sinense]